MSKISTYDVAPSPKLSDKLIGTSVGGAINDTTYNFTLQELLDLFTPNLPSNNLQGVLDNGNTATEDINLTGIINTTTLNANSVVSANANFLNEIRLNGTVYDVDGSAGTSGQILRSTNTGVQWFTDTLVTPTLQDVLQSGNTSNINIVLTSNISAVTATANNVVSNTNLNVNGSLTDSLSAVGTSGQLLSSTTSGVRWVDLPTYIAISPLLYDNGTKTFSIQVANSSQSGYLTNLDWVSFSSKQDSLNGTGLVKSTAGAISYITDNSTNWDVAYSSSIQSASVTGTTTKTLQLNQQSGGTVSASWTDTGIGVVGLSMPSAFNVANSPLTTDGTIVITGAGNTSQYVRGDGTLATFPNIVSGGSGAVFSYYMNGGTSQGSILGNTYYQMNSTPSLGASSNFSTAADGYIAQFITNAGDPAITNIPAGNWNFGFYFSAASNGGNPSFYVELYKYNGTAFTLLASNSTTPEFITGGTATDIYYSAIPVPQTTLTLTERLAIRVYVAVSGRTITMHTQASTLSQIQTTIINQSLNGSGTIGYVPKFATTTSLTDSNIQDSGTLISLGSNTNVSSGGLGIGTSLLTANNLRISKNLTGATSAFGILQDGVIQSDVTSAARLNNTNPSTAAAAFTLGSLQHYTAGTTTIGAGSTITNQFGFLVLSTAIGATNNYAFNGQLANAANTWNLYMSGSAPNYMVGALGIGQTNLTGRNLAVSRNISGAATSYGIVSDGTIQSDVTTTVGYYLSSANTAVASFNLTNIFHYLASQSTFGAGSVVTNQYGYSVQSNLIGATNNFGFRGAIPSGIGRWNLFMEGTADNYLAGNTGIGGASNSVSAGPILTATLTNGGSGYVDGTYTDVPVILISTGGTYALFTVVVSGGTVTTATVAWGGSNYKVGDTISISPASLGGTGGGLVITVATVDFSQLKVSSASTAGTDISLYRSSPSLNAGAQYGSIKFEGNDSSAKSSGVAAKIGAYAPGAAGGAYLSFFTSTGSGGALTEHVRIGNGGQVGIGGAYNLTQYGLRISKNITGSTISYNQFNDGIIQSDVTSQAHYFTSVANTAASAFTLGTLYHYRAIQGTFGVGSTVSAQAGFWADASLIGATTNYGFYGNIPAGTNRWNLYMNGTAQNFLNSATVIGSPASSTSGTSAGTGAMLTATITNGGSGYVNGTYTNVGTTAISSQGQFNALDVTVSGGIVTSITVKWGGWGYFPSDTITIPNTSLGGTGSGLVITVLTAESDVLRIQNSSSAKITLFNRSNTEPVGGEYGSYQFMGLRSVAGTTGIQAYISAIKVNSTNMGADMIFATRPAATYAAVTERMRLSSTGALLIGATTALSTAKLEVTGATLLNGNVAIGTGILSTRSLLINANLTNGTTVFGIENIGTIQSDVTSTAVYNRSTASTAAASFTLGALVYFNAVQGTFGAGSTVTTQTGFLVSSTLAGATTNFGFRSLIPASGTNNWNLYADGTAPNHMAGSLGIGTTSVSANTLRLAANISGGISSFAINSSGTIQSDVTTQAIYNNTTASTVAAAFTLPTLVHYNATQGTFGAGSTVTLQTGFNVNVTLIGATTNYGYRGQIPSGTNRWNIYMDGTADNYLAGALGIGSTSLTGYDLRISSNITGATTSFGASIDGTVQSEVTTNATYYNTQVSTAASAFTLTDLVHYSAAQGTFGAGSVVTNQYGFYVASSLVGATNDYGFFGDIASGANRWNLYMNGSASNYLNGVLTIGTATPNASAKVQIDSTTQGFLPPRMTAAQRTAIGTPATGLIVYQTDGVEGLWLRTSTGWKELTVV
jgi:hypothetical protein